MSILNYNSLIVVESFKVSNSYKDKQDLNNSIVPQLLRHRCLSREEISQEDPSFWLQINQSAKYQFQFAIN